MVAKSSATCTVWSQYCCHCSAFCCSSPRTGAHAIRGPRAPWMSGSCAQTCEKHGKLAARGTGWAAAPCFWAGGTYLVGELPRQLAGARVVVREGLHVLLQLQFRQVVARQLVRVALVRVVVLLHRKRFRIGY
jgi:hypothetical protein